MKTEIIRIRELDETAVLQLEKAAEVIKNGGLVVFPTETVYGLGGDATNEDSSKKIYAAKGRPSDNPLIIHIDTPEMAEKYAHTNEVYYKLAKSFMPGPLTVILESKDTIPLATRAGLSTVAVRCPQSAIARELIKRAGVPIAAPSANLSGSPSPTTAEHVIDDMQGRVDIIIDGGSSDFGLESTIVKIDNENEITLLRPGKITKEDLSKLVSRVNVADAVTDKLKDGEVVLSPGMKYKHYAPKAPVILLDGDVKAAVDYIDKNGDINIAIISYDKDFEHFKKAFPKAFIYNFGSSERPEDGAHVLFSILRDTDKHSFKEIYAPLPKASGIGLALYNRMIRAAAHKIIRL